MTRMDGYRRVFRVLRHQIVTAFFMGQCELSTYVFSSLSLSPYAYAIRFEAVNSMMLLFRYVAVLESGQRMPQDAPGRARG